MRRQRRRWDMRAYQRAFIEFALSKGLLRFGDFMLKSGRRSPYFFNTGRVDSGAALWRLAGFYADALLESGLKVDMLFGPAYKGIPLGTAVALVLAREHGRDLPMAFNRKEIKDHGEGGRLLGAPLAGRVLIVDDVITAGTSVNESVALIREAGAEPAGVLIALDRQERGTDSTLSAADTVGRRHGMPVQAIVGLAEVLEYLQDSPSLAASHDQVRVYRERYGASG